MGFLCYQYFLPELLLPFDPYPVTSSPLAMSLKCFLFFRPELSNYFPSLASVLGALLVAGWIMSCIKAVFGWGEDEPLTGAVVFLASSSLIKAHQKACVSWLSKVVCTCSSDI